MDGWVGMWENDKCMDEWTDGRMSEWVNEQRDGQMNGRTDGRKD